MNDNAGAVFTATCPHVLIGPGVYFVAFSSDSTTLRLSGMGSSTDYETILAAQPGTEQRFFLGSPANMSKGSSALALPSSFAGDTVTPIQEPLPKLVLLP